MVRLRPIVGRMDVTKINTFECPETLLTYDNKHIIAWDVKGNQAIKTVHMYPRIHSLTECGNDLLVASKKKINMDSESYSDSDIEIVDASLKAKRVFKVNGYYLTRINAIPMADGKVLICACQRSRSETWTNYCLRSSQGNIESESKHVPGYIVEMFLNKNQVVIFKEEFKGPIECYITDGTKLTKSYEKVVEHFKHNLRKIIKMDVSDKFTIAVVNKNNDVMIINSDGDMLFKYSPASADRGQILIGYDRYNNELIILDSNDAASIFYKIHIHDNKWQIRHKIINRPYKRYLYSAKLIVTRTKIVFLISEDDYIVHCKESCKSLYQINPDSTPYPFMSVIYYDCFETWFEKSLGMLLEVDVLGGLSKDLLGVILSFV